MGNVRWIGYGIAALLAFGGLMELLWVGPTQSIFRLIVALVLFGAAVTLVVLIRAKPPTQTHVHKMELDLTGDVKLEHINCRQCGAELSSESVKVAAGAVYVHCEYCGSQYQLEESPKW